MMIVASVFALPVLIGFLSPVLGSMSSSGGGGGALGIAAMGAAIPQDAIAEMKAYFADVDAYELKEA